MTGGVGRHRWTCAVERRRLTRQSRALQVADQAASSGTNFVISFLAARHLGADALGEFAIALLTYGIVLVIGRAVSSDVFVLDPPSDSPRTYAGANAAGALAAVACTVVGAVLLGPTLGPAYQWFWLSLPLLSLQDTARFIAFRTGRPGVAVCSDFVWGLAIVAMFALRPMPTEATSFIDIWSRAGVLSLGVSVLGLGSAFSPRSPVAWLRRRGREIAGLGVDSLLRTAETLGSPFVLVALASTAELGRLRAGQTAYSAATAAFVLVTSTLVGALSDEARTSRRKLDRRLLVLAIALIVGCFGTAAAVLSISDGAGRTILGESWDEARALALPLGAAHGFIALSLVYSVGLRVTGRRSYLAKLRLVSTPITLLTLAAASGTFGAVGYSWALAISAAIVGLAAVALYRERISPTVDNIERVGTLHVQNATLLSDP